MQLLERRSEDRKHNGLRSIEATLSALALLLHRPSKDESSKALLSRIAQDPEQMMAEAAGLSGVPIHPLRLIAELQDMLTPDVTFSIDNNATERALRCFAVGRANWTFFGSDRGGKTAAVLRSFVTLCELVKVDPFAWFHDVLSRIADHPITKLDELLPHRWAAVYCSPSSSGGFTRMKI